MSDRYILALDQGTTSSRAMIVDAKGEVRAVAQRAFRQIFPQPGWVEHDATEIWSSQAGMATEALAAAGLVASDIAGLGITNQRETAVVWDRRTGEPIYHAIVWQDRRTSEFCDQLNAQGHTAMIQQKTGLIPDAYFSGSKVRWMLDNVKGARARAERGELAFGTVDSWLIWKLTNGKRHVTDVTNACRTMLFNINTLMWDDDLLELLDIPKSMLPEVVQSSGICGTTEGVVDGIPIAGIAGDQQAALFGQMCTEPGMVKCTFGTGSFMLLNIGEQATPSKHKLLTTIAWGVDGKTEYALEGSMLMAGAVVQWLRDGLQIIRSSAEVEALAQSVPDTGGVMLVPAFSGLGAPHWDQYARGALVGMTRGTTKAHIARAALEGIALQVADVLEAMQADSGLQLAELRVDGGAAANDLLMQMQADVLGVRVVRPKNAEATAMGAAYLAGLAVGYWPDRKAIAQQWQTDKIFEPKMSDQERSEKRARWRKALGRAQAWEVA
ncbi:MAG TPA: glycerol kinase GlpK [Edaphobacter sp.]|nr:glycerol kinase GlpK [Edaphobacter sp.]